MAVLCALRVVVSCIEGNSAICPPIIAVRAGGPQVCCFLCIWTHAGKLTPQSAAAAPVAGLGTPLAIITHCPILAEWAENPEVYNRELFRECDMEVPQDVIGAS